MARLIGVNIPDNKRIKYALTFIYGISWSRAGKILLSTSIDENVRVQDLSEDDLKKIQDFIETNYKVEGDLREDVSLNIKRLRETGTYRGIRHIRGLPVRGQRTRSNARTKRGKRKTVGALKKEDMAKLQ
ncbi:30S ribosomal protein S13, partial [Candidatus Roizmanbacteria bacterium RIFCSPLOWO2_12_FULL_37_7b]